MFWYGVLGFVAMFLHGLNTVKKVNDRMGSLKMVGGGLVGLSLLEFIPSTERELIPGGAMGFGILAGIFALLLFAALLVVRAMHHSSYLPFTGRSTVGLFSTVTAVAIFALITFGVTDYIFYDRGMYFLFFTVFGMGSSLLRISRNQHDDRLIYYSDMNPSSSATDVKIG